jgi:hypothetical protein
LKSALALNISRGDGEIKQWGGEGGRVSLKKIRSDCAAIGINFK